MEMPPKISPCFKSAAQFFFTVAFIKKLKHPVLYDVNVIQFRSTLYGQVVTAGIIFSNTDSLICLSSASGSFENGACLARNVSTCLACLLLMGAFFSRLRAATNIKRFSLMRKSGSNYGFTVTQRIQCANSNGHFKTSQHLNAKTELTLASG